MQLSKFNTKDNNANTLQGIYKYMIRFTIDFMT